MVLNIQLLGQFNLRIGDYTVELSSRPAQSLFAYLALTSGIRHRRERLAALLWPDATEANSRGYLRQALWRIRKAFSTHSISWEEFLQINDISVRFNDRADYCLDAERILEESENQTIEEIISAVNLYQGDLLPGFYDEWIFPERDRLLAAFQQKMNLLLQRLLSSSRWDDVLHWSEEWVRLGYSPEPAYQAMMRAYAGKGDLGMVETSYRRCLEALERDLDVVPSIETQSLYEQFRQRVPVNSVLSTGLNTNCGNVMQNFHNLRDSHPSEKPLFVAREKELAKLEEYLDRAFSGQGKVIFNIGEAGSGKTALLNEFAQHAQDAHHDLIVAAGNCNAHTGLGDPYLPFREIMELLTGDVESRCAVGAISNDHAQRLWSSLPVVIQAVLEAGPELIDTFVNGSALVERAVSHGGVGNARLNSLTSLVRRKTSNTATPGPQQTDLFKQYTKVLQALARENPMLLLLDDLQWADPGSISLLFHLGRNLSGTQMLVVGAFRPEEVVIAGDGAQHPLKSVINEFQRISGDITINLDQAEKWNFVEAIVDSEPNQLEQPFREMLQRQTLGNPLFTIELLRGMQERGDLVQNNKGEWIAGQTLDWDTVPARVEAVIAQRIGRLAQPLQAILRVACVEGEIFTAEVVSEVVGKDPHEVLENLSRDLDRRHRLIRARSIQRIDDHLLSRYQFRHIQIQKYLYSNLDDVERVYLHEQVGNALETLHSMRENDSGVEISAIAPQVARHFQEARILHKAINYLRQAGERTIYLCAYREAIDLLKRAQQLLLSEPASSKRDRRELELQLVLGMAWKGVKGYASTKVEDVYVRALELCKRIGNNSQLFLIQGELAIVHYVRAEHRKALTKAEETLHLARLADDPFLTLLAHWHIGIAQFGLGNFAQARRNLQEVESFYSPKYHRKFLSLRGSDPGPSALAYDACCLWCLGYPDQALRKSQAALTMARELGHPFTMADVLCFSGCVLSDMRRDYEALKKYADEMTRLSNEMVEAWMGTGLVFKGAAAMTMGQIEDGIDFMRQGLSIRESRGTMCYTTEIMISFALSELAAGHHKESLAIFERILLQVEKSDERYFEAEIYRQRAQVLTVMGESIEAESNLIKAVEIARAQRAKSWELRAAVSLARLWQQQNKCQEALQLLQPVFDWFDEGFDTTDLQEASALLDELSE